MSRLQGRLCDELGAAISHSRFRELQLPDGIDCSSNDYLGLSTDSHLRDAILNAASEGGTIGATGSRLLSGNHRQHCQAEERFASFAGRERALLFNSGFTANLAILSAIPTRHDLILLDSSAHASLKEGARASLAARRTFRHNDLADLRRRLHDRGSFRDLFLVVEGVYSMDGDLAPIAEITDIVREVDAHLIVDEAHATGIYGRNLRGVHDLTDLSLPPLITVHPCGKAFGLSGAFVAADRVVIDYLVNNARPFLFSTAISPLIAAGLSAVLDLQPLMKERSAALLARAARFRGRLQGLRRWRVIPSDGPIVPVIIGSDSLALRASRLMLEMGGFVALPIRPPTVPEGSARLRISLSWQIDDDTADRLADTILAVEKQMETEYEL
jgi:8-amino-7-oxononanoate synthase